MYTVFQITIYYFILSICFGKWITMGKFSLEQTEILARAWNKWHLATSTYSCFSVTKVISNSLWPHGLQHSRPPCPSPTPGVHSNSCSLSQWCHPTITSSVVPFFSCLQSFPASGSFPMSQFFASGDQSIRVSASASVLPMNIEGWFPLGLTGLISLLSKGLSRAFSNSTVQKHQFFGTQTSLWSNSHIRTWLLENQTKD